MPVKDLADDSPPPPARRTPQGTELGVPPAPPAPTQVLPMAQTIPPPATFSVRQVLKRCSTCRLDMTVPEDGHYCPTCCTRLTSVETGPSMVISREVFSPPTKKLAPRGRSPGPGTVMRVMGELRAADREGYVFGLFLLIILAIGAALYYCFRVPGH